MRLCMQSGRPTRVVDFRFAVRGLALLVVLLAICMFLARGIRTITHRMNTPTSPQSARGQASQPCSVAYVTVPNGETARSLTTGILAVCAKRRVMNVLIFSQNKLAACVSTIPGVTSSYMWEGKVEESQEFMLMIKTRSSLLPELTDYVVTHHPYKVAEVIATDVCILLIYATILTYETD